MALRKLVDRLTKPIEELDRRALADWRTARAAIPLDEIQLRRPVRVAGEIRSVRIVPRAGADAMEVTVNDGTGSVTAVFLGRRKIHGMAPGRRVELEGVVGRAGGRAVVYNPLYMLA
jgi:DNA/RNA endonuclease YhcR with UshA esterase domain